jgi:hypothetical protein
MDRTTLKHPLAAYPRRFNRFLWLLVSVRGLESKGRSLFRVMDGTAFQDTETALETELFNAGRRLDSEQADRLVLAVMTKDGRAAND